MNDVVVACFNSDFLDFSLHGLKILQRVEGSRLRLRIETGPSLVRNRGVVTTHLQRSLSFFSDRIRRVQIIYKTRIKQQTDEISRLHSDEYED